MLCTSCKTTNDPDAAFCSQCGGPLAGRPEEPGKKQRKPYLFALLFVPVLVAAAAVGYYKFFLPDGVAAVVNGEEIRLSELNNAVSRMRGAGEAVSAGIRYEALNELIAERLVLQEARKAGLRVSKDDVASTVTQAQAASGLGADAFSKEIKSVYGSMRDFENAMERRILINRLIAERVVPPGTDPRAASMAMNQWLQALSGKASVRITLAEQWSGSSCGCCNKDGGQAQPRASDKSSAAVDAGLQYWRAKHGADGVSARPTDFGCHIQVDIVKNEKIIGSLRYQGGAITEL